jgi:hypothetical protein
MANQARLCGSLFEQRNYFQPIGARHTAALVDNRHQRPTASQPTCKRIPRLAVYPRHPACAFANGWPRHLLPAERRTP